MKMLLPLLAALVLIPATPAVAAPAPDAPAHLSQQGENLLAARGFGGSRGFGTTRTRPGIRPGANTRSSRPVRRPSGRAFFGNMLKILGLAYLFNLLFGWGPGGSPLGLLLIVGLVVLFVVARRSRRQSDYA